MVEMTTVEQAQFIFSFGQKMRNHVLAIQSRVQEEELGFGDGEGLSMAQLPMVLVINKHQGITISALAEELTVSVPSASAMVDRLVDRGIVARERSAQDRRVVLVSLTAKTASFVAQVEKAILSSFITIVDKVGPDIASQWCHVLSVVDGALEK